ncbi:MAG: hypothetical protein K6T17_03980 [Fimbriimonadales bacterium]|nr:hypothetical protein [Fimbriimonadales bacterium]
MNDIQRADLKIIAKSALNPWRLMGLAFAGWIGSLLMGSGEFWPWMAILLWGSALGLYGASIRNDFLQKRFRTPEHRVLWDLIEDRLRRFHHAVKRAPQEVRRALEDTPQTVDLTARKLYIALRKADLVRQEIERSEGKVIPPPPILKPHSSDRETTELYVLADKNIAEYRRSLEAVNAHVTRTEGQCAVFLSALDSLRVQLLGHRLRTTAPAVPQPEFREAMTGIKRQLDSITKALKELETFLATTEFFAPGGSISSQPPPPDEEQQTQTH